LRFCAESADTFDWLEKRVGVPFKNTEGKTVYYKTKTSYPPSSATLYQSGNEAAYPFSRVALPAARGNRPFGDYLTGNVLFSAFERAVESNPRITVAMHTAARELVKDPHDEDAVVGVALESLPSDWTDVTAVHVMLHEIGSGSTMLDPSGSVMRACLAREAELFAAFGRRRTVRAPAVVVATGGFFYNQDMVLKHAPRYHGYMPLGNLGDDGSGIAMCERAGAELGCMDRCSAWKFINPPYSFVRGVLVNAAGERVGNEDVYGATFADFLIQRHGGKGFLVVDQTVWDEANRDCMDPDSGLQEDQRMQGLANLFKNRVEADTVEGLAQKTGAAKLVETMARYNEAAAAGFDAAFRKGDAFLKGVKYWPTPCMSLGGVRVDGETGRAISRATGKPMRGLYAAGKSAVGIASNYYVSGLSLGDAVFAGRRAARSAAKL